MTMSSTAPDSGFAQSRLAMRLSLGFGILMLAGKCFAWWITGSSAILSDALESVIHVVAVAFAAFSLSLSYRPANERYLYGFERINYFSAGFEGAMIVLAAIAIIAAAVHKWLHGLDLNELGFGTMIVTAASLINGALGAYLIWIGRKHRSLILQANGKHVLTDCYTSVGVIIGLVLVILTGWKPFDPICAILVALNILWSGGQLMWRATQGLLDFADPGVGKQIRGHLDRICAPLAVEYHGVRFRESGNRLLVEVHLLFPFQLPLGDAHSTATLIEEQLESSLDRPCEIVTHLEAAEDHEGIHHNPHYTGRPK